MTTPVKIYCQCGHLEFDHKYRDTTPEKLLEGLSRDPSVTVIHDPNSMGVLGYKTATGLYFTYQKALEEVKDARENHSYCRPDMFDSKCDCKVFRMDNLKYLEDLDERKTS